MKFRTGSYANVASTLALVVALGGTSYAAVGIAKNSVASRQIVNNSVKSVDVKNGNLKAVDFRAGELPAGATGATGAQGPVGPQGPIGPSNGYGIGSSFLPAFWTGAQQTIRTLALPAGSYVLSGKAMANNGASAAEVNCQLRVNGTTVDGSSSVGLGTSVSTDRAYIPLAVATTLAADSSVTLTCEASTADGSFSDAAITAVKVGAIG